MSKLYVKLYTPFVITGQDFPSTDNSFRRIVFSPDNVHSISVVGLRDGTLLITNEGQTSFQFSLSRNRKVLAVIKYSKDVPYLSINNNWRIKKWGVQNCTINENPDLVFSPQLNVDFTGTGLGRVDIKFDDSGFACLTFSDKDLLFVRMNGNHSFPRLTEHIEAEIWRSVSAGRVAAYIERNPQFLNSFFENHTEIFEIFGRRFFQNWVRNHEWGLN